jgi:50S ribosomal protein L16 3-hydroxylase
MNQSFLAGLTRAEFLRRHWQKKPLLARNALDAYAGALTRDELFELATRDTVESRVVIYRRGRWEVHHGPFARADLQRLPRTGWTLLVHGVDLAVAKAARLLREFAFLPYARFDDVMVSYAAPGGGVGPHFDSFDVFLVQTHGKRRWRVSTQRDLALVPDMPLKILRTFKPEREWTARPGDVLYLPPRHAHDGVALDDCITCSVGFRAPADQELASRFLDFLQDRLSLAGDYSDPDLQRARRPARIPPAMLERGRRVLDTLRWSARDVEEFMGRYLTEPKDHVLFERPAKPLAIRDFAQRAKREGVHLELASRMLFHRRGIYINGEAATASVGAARTLTRLADARELKPPLDLARDARELLYAWYIAGYIGLGTSEA